ncbi:hypothetical protein FKM82_006506 [Ascaphus truei]
MRSFSPLTCMWICRVLLTLSCLVLCTNQLSQRSANLSCDHKKQYDLGGRCCTKCQPGSYLSSKCTATSDTACNPCGPNEYLEIWNEYHQCSRQVMCDVATAKEDTLCITCPIGYFSNSSSTTEECKPWTNCTEVGLLQLDLGTNHSDVLCDHKDRSNLTGKTVKAILGIISFILLLAMSVSCIVYYRKKLKELTAGIQQWVNEACYRFQGATERSACNAYSSKNNQGSNGQKNSDKYVLVPIDTCCTNNHVSEQGNCRTSDCRPETVVANNFFQCRSIPTQDEYMEEIAGMTPLSEPLEVGENESISDCFTATEFMSDTEEASQGSDSIPAFSDRCSQRLHCCTCQSTLQDGLAINHSPLQQGPSGSLHACEPSAREFHEKRTEKNHYEKYVTTEPVESASGHSSQCSCGLDCSQTSHSAPDEATAEETYPHFTDTKHPSSSKSTAGRNSTSDTPPQSGNVTGNNNATFISSGQVMNFKGDVIVVYVSQNSQEAPAANESNEANMANPVQEENQSRCDSFVANTQHDTGKYADIPSTATTNREWWKPATDPGRGPDCPVTLSQVQNGTQYCHNVDFIPVQEEGKPEYFNFEEWL